MHFVRFLTENHLVRCREFSEIFLRALVVGIGGLDLGFEESKVDLSSFCPDRGSPFSSPGTPRNPLELGFSMSPSLIHVVLEVGDDTQVFSGVVQPISVFVIDMKAIRVPHQDSMEVFSSLSSVLTGPRDLDVSDAIPFAPGRRLCVPFGRSEISGVVEIDERRLSSAQLDGHATLEYDERSHGGPSPQMVRGGESSRVRILGPLSARVILRSLMRLVMVCVS